MEIKDYPNYLIYPDGKIFSKKRNKYLTLNPNKMGYVYADLRDNGKKQKKARVHRLVAIHYIPNPYNYDEVDHINRIRNDNRVENLRWANRSINSSNRLKKFPNKKEYDKKYYEKKKEHKKQQTKEYRDKNREKIREQRKKYRHYQNSWGGDKRRNNNLLEIDINLFKI